MIKTMSAFYYIDQVNTSNFFLNFDEGSGELTAEIEVGSYTPSQLAKAVQAALNNVGTLAYTVSFDRELRAFEISSTANFSLLISTGINNGNDIFPLLGFTGADLSGSGTYIGDTAGGVYFPQFWLQDFVAAEDNQASISPVVVKSASGIVEVVKFGNENIYEFDIMFATDYEQGKGSVIETNLNGVGDLRDFMRFAVTKQSLEFMPDRDNPNDFDIVLLESTEKSSDGTGFKLKEMYSSGLVGYFSTGLVRFRLVED
jgi:hypothetical protein